MALPTGVVTRQVTFGPAFSLAEGTSLAMKVKFTPSRSMVWGAFGAPGIAREYGAPAPLGLQGSIALPVTDQAGWLDGLGNVLSVANGAHTHTYQVLVQYFDADGAAVATSDARNITLPAGDLSPVDLDVLIPVSTTAGVILAIPDLWSQQVAAAQAAALAAQAAAAAAVTFRGAWSATTFYPANTLITYAGAVYLAASTVPARATFNAGDWIALSGTAGGTVDPLIYLTLNGDPLTLNGDPLTVAA